MAKPTAKAIAIRCSAVLTSVLGLAWLVWALGPSRTIEQGQSCSGESMIVGKRYGLLFYSDELMQAANYGPFAENGNARELILREKRRNAEGGYDKADYSFLASFNIFEVRASGRDVFYLIGNDDQGVGVMQKWERVPAFTPGSVVATHAGSPASEGCAMLQTAVYSLPTIRALRAFGVDPEERYAYVIHTPPEGAPNQLARLPLPPGPPIAIEFDAAQLPLLEAAELIFPHNHVFHGRIWVIEAWHDERVIGDRTVLIDGNNDGMIDSALELDNAGFVSFIGAYTNLIPDGVTFF